LDLSPELLVIGRSPAGLSVASRARRAGIESVLVVGSPDAALIGDLAHLDRMDMEQVDAIEGMVWRDGRIELETKPRGLSAPNVVVDLVAIEPDSGMPWEIPPNLAHRVHRRVDFDPEDQDVLIVGKGDSAVIIASRLIQTRARLVLAFDGGTSSISMLGRQVLERLEREQLATILWRSWPERSGRSAISRWSPSRAAVLLISSSIMSSWRCQARFRPSHFRST